MSERVRESNPLVLVVPSVLLGDALGSFAITGFIGP